VAVIYIVLPLSLVLVALAVGVFIWTARSGQLDDLDSPAVRVLFDDEDAVSAPEAHGSSPGPARRRRP
jgi:cbb3-type cytochrome oxidase maturation protein